MNFIVFASLLLIFSTAVRTEELPYEVNESLKVEERLFGGFNEVSVRSREIKDLAQIAVNRHLYDIKSECNYDVKKIRRAGTQLVQGLKTALKLRMCGHCGDKAEKCEECYVETFEQVWIRLFEVTKFYCSPFGNSKKPKGSPFTEE